MITRKQQFHDSNYKDFIRHYEWRITWRKTLLRSAWILC